MIVMTVLWPSFVTLSRPMKVATPMFCSFRKVTHLWAVSMVSTTMLSRAPQLEEMATSYFSSIAPRSPFECQHGKKER